MTMQCLYYYYYYYYYYYCYCYYYYHLFLLCIKRFFSQNLRINHYITATVNLACYWRSDCSDCGDEAKRCEQEKQQVGWG